MRIKISFFRMFFVGFLLLQPLTADDAPLLEKWKSLWQKSGNPAYIDSIQGSLPNQPCAWFEWEARRPAKPSLDPEYIFKIYRLHQSCDSSEKASQAYVQILKPYPKESAWYRHQAQMQSMMGRPERAGDFLACGAILGKDAAHLWLEASFQYKAAHHAQKAVAAVFAASREEKQDPTLALQHLKSMSREDSLYAKEIDQQFKDARKTDVSLTLCFEWFLFRWNLEKAYQTACKMSPVVSRDSLLVLLMKKALDDGRFGQAEKIFASHPVISGPFQDEWIQFRAYLEKASGHAEAAQAIYHEQWRKKGSIRTALDYAALLLRDLHDPAQALLILRQAEPLQKTQSETETFLRLAFESSLLLHDFHSAAQFAEVFKNGLGGQGLSGYYFALGELEATRGNIAKAMEQWTLACKEKKGKDVNDALWHKMLFSDLQMDSLLFARFWNARLLAKSGKYENASDSLMSLLHRIIGPAKKSLTILASQWLVEGGKAQDAIRLLQEIVEADTTCDACQHQLAQIYLHPAEDTLSGLKAYETLLLKHPQSLFTEEARQMILQLGKRGK